MEEKTIDIIYKYSKANKDVDCDFINQVATIAIKYYCLEEFIKKVNTYDIKLKADASYFIDTKEILIYFKSLSRTLSSIQGEFKSIQRTSLFKYLYSVKVLYHEMEHASQQKKIKDQNDIESEILRAEYSPINDIEQNNILLRIPKMIYLNRLKDKYYEFSPSERLAEIYSNETVQKLSLIMEDEISRNIMEYFKLDNLLRGYNTGLIQDLSDTPTKTYLEKINPNYDYSNIENLSKNIDDESLMKFGLEASKEQLNKTAKKRFVLEKQLIY